jgi:HK97 gp10 family phage protein
MANRAIFNAKKIFNMQSKGVHSGLAFVAISLQKRIRKRLSRAGSGIQYPGNPARSSAPGQPPVAQSSLLRNSWVAGVKSKFRTRRKFGVRLAQGAGFGEATKYAVFLEGGTKHMAPRPFLRPSVDQIRPRAVTIFLSRYGKVMEQIDRSGPHG